MKKLLVLFISLFTLSVFAESDNVCQSLEKLQFEIRNKGIEICKGISD